LLGATASVAHAELVALGVGHHQPAVAVFFADTGLKPASAETLQADSLALDIWRLEVEVNPVLGELGFWYRLQQELGAPRIRGSNST
jgi:hypothetical protein